MRIILLSARGPSKYLVMQEPKEFFKKVLATVKKIPKGKVATYGQIAHLSGKPHAARGVGWILHSSAVAYGLPWHRVLNARGKISFLRDTQEYAQQKKLLKRERIFFHTGDQIDLAKFQWKKTVRKARGSRPQPKMFS